MGLASYAVASNENAKELATSLANADISALASDLSGTGLPAWLRWQDENEGEIQDYVAATPLARARKKRWCEPVLRRRLVLAAITHCLAAAELLGFLARHDGALAPLGPYRDTTALAGSAYWKIAGTEIPDWPAEFERHCPSPFE